MASFEKASVKLDRAEGGYSVDKSDKGNYLNGVWVGTNYGISAPTLASWRGKRVTESDMRSLTYNEALKIYKKNYWDYLKLDKVKDQSVAEMLFDAQVNKWNGNKIYERATGEKYSPDSVNSHKDQEKLFNKLKQARIDDYSAMNDSHKSGWVDRVNRYLYEGVKIAQDTQKFAKKNIVPIILISVGGMAIIGTVLYLVIKKKIK